MFSNQNKKITTICFIGIDGSGKTTQAKQFLKDIKKRNETEYIHVLSRKSTFSGKLQETSIMRYTIKKIRFFNNNSLGSIINLLLRVSNVLIDSWTTFLINKRNYKQKIIVYDRHFYDILVIIAYSYMSLSNIIIKLSKFIQRPDIVVLLKIKPKTAIKRKNEHTLIEAEKFCMLYEKLGETLNIPQINGELKIEEVTQNIKKLFNGILL